MLTAPFEPMYSYCNILSNTDLFESNDNQISTYFSDFKCLYYMALLISICIDV